MKYMLLIYADPAVAPQSEAEHDALFHGFQTWTADLRSSGAFVTGDPLAPPSSATTVRVRDEKLGVTDGPYAETKEWLGGFCIIEAASLDSALEIASKCPGAKHGSVEIRPIAVI